MTIDEFIWPEERIEHIARHGVTPEDVEEVCFGNCWVRRAKAEGENPVYLPVYLTYRGVVGTFRWSLLWLLAVPFVVGIIDTVIVGFSWSLAYRKQFRYDYERRVSSWVEGGQERTYTYADWQGEQT